MDVVRERTWMYSQRAKKNMLVSVRLLGLAYKGDQKDSCKTTCAFFLRSSHSNISSSG